MIKNYCFLLKFLLYHMTLDDKEETKEKNVDQPTERFTVARDNLQMFNKKSAKCVITSEFLTLTKRITR